MSTTPTEKHSIEAGDLVCDYVRLHGENLTRQGVILLVDYEPFKRKPEA